MRVKCTNSLDPRTGRYGEALGGGSYKSYLVQEKEYDVLGVMFFKGVIIYLVLTKVGFFWCAKGAFELTDNHIPPWWKIRTTEDPEDIKYAAEMLISYPRMIDDPTHNEDLISNQYPDAIWIAEEELKKVQAWHASLSGEELA